VVRVVVEMPGISRDKMKMHTIILSKSKAKILKGNKISPLKYQQIQISKWPDLPTIIGYWK
jgi:hypothetical protein